MARNGRKSLPLLEKCPTGIPGFDDVVGGGLPRGRTALVCGGAGCGKTLFGMQFLVRGALDHGEPGVFVAFEETVDDLARNVASLGFDLADLQQRKLLEVDHVRVERSEIEESGEYDLEGLFLRLNLAIDSIQAKRVVIDTLETLFAGLQNHAVLRDELRRLFRWLKEKGVTSIVTAERGAGALTRHGLEEYVSDCVILLDHRVVDQVSTRRLRVVKYRGSTHGTNEYPFLIDETGFSVVPITSAGLHHGVSDERLPTGVARLDAMLGGGGYYRGSSVLVSATAGAGKTSLCSHFAAASCARGLKCLFFAFEESPAQIRRNMLSIGVDLPRWEKKGLLRFVADRPTTFGLEMHLAVMHRAVREFAPDVVILDPVSTLLAAGNPTDAHLVMVRLIDLLKARGITCMMSSLTAGGQDLERTEIAISSIVDTWLLLKWIEIGGERNRGIYVLKSRGMRHSNQIRELVISDAGIELLDVYLGPEGVLTGSARAQQEATDRATQRGLEQALGRRRRELEAKRLRMEERIAALRAEHDGEEAELLRQLEQHEDGQRELRTDRDRMARSRQTDAREEGNHSPGRGRNRKPS